MPHLDGFEVVAALGDAQQPAVIFVTAHDQYAVRAFEVHAFDYLLKPVDHDRLREAIGWAVATAARIPAGSTTGRILALLEELRDRDRGRGRDRLVVRTPERAIFLRTETIDWIEAAGKFVHLHVGRAVHALRESMAELEQELDSARFLRISRSAIVNLDRIQEVQPWFQGDYVLILTDGTRLTSTRGYRENMRRLLGRSA
jgi:two-component system LytT family response regulator